MSASIANSELIADHWIIMTGYVLLLPVSTYLWLLCCKNQKDPLFMSLIAKDSLIFIGFLCLGAIFPIITPRISIAEKYYCCITASATLSLTVYLVSAIIEIDKPSNPNESPKEINTQIPQYKKIVPYIFLYNLGPLLAIIHGLGMVPSHALLPVPSFLMACGFLSFFSTIRIIFDQKDLYSVLFFLTRLVYLVSACYLLYIYIFKIPSLSGLAITLTHLSFTFGLDYARNTRNTYTYSPRDTN